MILRPCARQGRALLNSSTARSRLFRNSNPFSLHQARSLHEVPRLGPREESFADNGVGDLFSAPAFKVAWTDYQTHLVNRLNTILADDTTRQEWDVQTLVRNTAREPSMAPMFNYASMAHNNHFFFQTLSPTTIRIPDPLANHLVTSFSSVETLRSTFLTTAAAMFGPGFVWLVQTDKPSSTHPAAANAATQSMGSHYRSQLHFRIVATYLAGSPYPQAHTRQQGRDMNTQNLQTAGTANKSPGAPASVESASHGGMAGIPFGEGENIEDPRRYGGADIMPVLCVNTWEHCYLHDFGVAGKKAYLEKWWDSIDWNVVWSHCFKPRQYGEMR